MCTLSLIYIVQVSNCEFMLLSCTNTTLTGSTAVMFNADCRTTFSLPTIYFKTTAKKLK